MHNERLAVHYDTNGDPTRVTVEEVHGIDAAFHLENGTAELTVVEPSAGFETVRVQYLSKIMAFVGEVPPVDDVELATATDTDTTATTEGTDG